MKETYIKKLIERGNFSKCDGVTYFIPTTTDIMELWQLRAIADYIEKANVSSKIWKHTSRTGTK